VPGQPRSVAVCRVCLMGNVWHRVCVRERKKVRVGSWVVPPECPRCGGWDGGAAALASRRRELRVRPARVRHCRSV
jgi:hypothetical protein